MVYVESNQQKKLMTKLLGLVVQKYHTKKTVFES